MLELVDRSSRLGLQYNLRHEKTQLKQCENRTEVCSYMIGVLLPAQHRLMPIEPEWLGRLITRIMSIRKLFWLVYCLE